MGAILTGLLAVLSEIATLTAQGSVITKIISTLVSLIPTLIQEYKDVAPAVKNIIAALSANPATTTEQLAALQELDAKVDVDFEDAATAAQAEDDAADKPAA